MEHLEPYRYCRPGWRRCADDEVLGRVSSLLTTSPALPPVGLVVVVVVVSVAAVMVMVVVGGDAAVSPSQRGVGRD